MNPGEESLGREDRDAGTERYLSVMGMVLE